MIITNSVWIEKIRVADTNAYTANDAIDVSVTVPTGFIFTLGKSGGTGTLIDAHIATDMTANVSAYDLDLYSGAITYPNDNAEAIRSYANALKFIGTVSFPAVAKKTANSTHAESVPSAVLGLPLRFDASGNIYGVLRTVTGFTPTSGQKFTIRLGAKLDF